MECGLYKVRPVLCPAGHPSDVQNGSRPFCLGDSFLAVEERVRRAEGRGLEKGMDAISEAYILATQSLLLLFLRLTLAR